MSDINIDPPPRPFMDGNEIVSMMAVMSLFDAPVQALEWGSGNSTLFFSALLPAGSQWEAIEHNEQWSKTVQDMIQQRNAPGIWLHFVPNSGPFRDGVDDGDYDSFSEYILTATHLHKKFQFVLVDGRARVECMQIGWMLLQTSGFLVLHDAERTEYNPGIPSEAFQVRITNIAQPDRKSVLFMGKEKGNIATLRALLLRLMPSHVEISTNIAAAEEGRLEPQGLIRLGEMLANTGFQQEAMQIFLGLLESDPQCGDAYNNLGVLLAELGKLDEAIKILSLGRHVLPNNTVLAQTLETVCGIVQRLGAQVPSELVSPNIQENISLSDSWRLEKGEKPFCLFVNTCYPTFLNTHYAQYQGLHESSYGEQKRSLQETFFGDADFYSAGLKAAGWEADDVVVNCEPLQAAWARENGFQGAGLEIFFEQIRRARPHVLYIQDMNLASREFMARIRPYTALIVGQIASPIGTNVHAQGFDVIVSSFPHFVERFRAAGITAYYQPLAFEPRILDVLGPLPQRIHPLTFVGGISSAHGKGKDFLEQLARRAPVDFWGYGRDTLLLASPILPKHHGEVWGRDMFRLLLGSRMTINRHIDVAENYANNMRLFEATGCGALLFTDYKDNLSDLFEIGKEVVAYRSVEECAALIDYYLNNPDEADAIARAGQARTLRDHTYMRRMAQTGEFLRRHLRYRSEAGKMQPVDISQVSSNIRRIGQSDITPDLTSAWQSEDIPLRQRALVQQELAAMYKNHPPKVYSVLADCLYPILEQHGSLLEIGCASGYYYEVLSYLLNFPIRYTGADYSESLISQARDYYPEARFFVADGASLPFSDGEFDVAVSSSILLHVPNYTDHIRETSRVARNYVIAHRTPVRRLSATTYFKKSAYGVDTVELHFNEGEFLRLFAENGLEHVGTVEYGAAPERDEYDITYVFRKIAGS